MEYYVEWDDQDPSGRHVPIKHLAVNKPPDEDEIGTLLNTNLNRILLITRMFGKMRRLSI